MPETVTNTNTVKNEACCVDCRILSTQINPLPNQQNRACTRLGLAAEPIPVFKHPYVVTGRLLAAIEYTVPSGIRMIGHEHPLSHSVVYGKMPDVQGCR